VGVITYPGKISEMVVLTANVMAFPAEEKKISKDSKETKLTHSFAIISDEKRIGIIVVLQKNDS
jgi:hypothetical protein